MAFNSNKCMDEKTTAMVLDEAEDIHGPNRSFAKGIAEQIKAGNITDWVLASRILDVMAGNAIGKKTFDFQAQPNIGEFLTSDLFGSMPTNQQKLIAICLFDGVSYSTLGNMGLLEPRSENQVNMYFSSAIKALAGAVDAGIISAENAKEIIDSTPHISAQTSREMVNTRPDERREAFDYVYNQTMQKCSEALGIDIAKREVQNSSFDSPNVANRLFVSIGNGNFTPEGTDQIKHILVTPGVFETEVQPIIDKHIFDEYQKTNDFKRDLKDLKECVKECHPNKEEKALCKQIYQAYKKGIIKSKGGAEKLISAINHMNHHMSAPSQEDIAKLTSEKFGQLPYEQQVTVVELMERQISFDTIEKLGLLEQGKDKEQFFEFDDHTFQVVYESKYYYNFSETDIVAGAIKGGIPLDNIKKVLDTLPYLSVAKRADLEIADPEKFAELQNYVGAKIVDEMINYLGYDSIEDSPFESVKEAEQLLEGIGNKEVRLYEHENGLYKEFSKETSMEDKFQRNKEKSNDIADSSPKKETVKTTEQTIGA